MGILERLSRLIRSNINDLIARSENPEKMLNQIIEDMRHQLAKAKQEVAMSISDERKLRAQFEKERKQAGEWERKARLALNKGREDLARQALMRGQEHAAHAAQFEEQWRKHKADTEMLKGSMRQLNDKIQEARRKKNLLIAKQRRAEAQQRIHETMQGLQAGSAFQAFDRMEAKIEEAERMALASAEVADELSGDSLISEFAQLEAAGGDAEVEEKLLMLKGEMGLLPASEDEDDDLLRLLEGSETSSDEVPEAKLLERDEA